jgi:NDP-sugar pyrophosphorylase family protein
MSGITKALILTGAPVEADRWRTLGVHARPLVPLANRPVVLHTLDALQAAGVREATVLADGGLRAALGEVLGRGTPDLTIRFADHVDEQALDARALVVEPADALLRGPLDAVLGEIGADDIDGAVLRLPPPAASSITEVAACVLGQDAAVAMAGDLNGSDGTIETVADALMAGSRRVRVG